MTPHAGQTATLAIMTLEAATRRDEYTLAPTVAEPAPGKYRIDASPTKRRLQALVAHGYSMLMICEAFEWEPYWLDSTLRETTVQTSVATYVARLYPALAFAKPTYTSDRRRNEALREQVDAHARGWLGPLDYDDIERGIVAEDGPAFMLIAPDAALTPIGWPANGPANEEQDYVDAVAIELAIEGKHPRLTLREREEAIARMQALGMGNTVVADYVGMTYKEFWKVYLNGGQAEPQKAKAEPTVATPSPASGKVTRITRRRKKTVTKTVVTEVVEMVELDIDFNAA